MRGQNIFTIRALTTHLVHPMISFKIKGETLGISVMSSLTVKTEMKTR